MILAHIVNRENLRLSFSNASSSQLIENMTLYGAERPVTESSLEDSRPQFAKSPPNISTVVAAITCTTLALIAMIYLFYVILSKRKSRMRSSGKAEISEDYEEIVQNAESPSSLSPLCSVPNTLTSLLRRSSVPYIGHQSQTGSDIPFRVPSTIGSVCGVDGRRRLSEGGEYNGVHLSPGHVMATASASANVTLSGGAYSLGRIDPRLYKRAGEEDDDDDLDNYPEGHCGRLSFAVQYMREAEKLLVTVIEARNLPRRRDGGGACDPFVKICLLPDIRSNVQSKFRKKTCNPKFEESFVFPVSQKTLEERVLKLTVYDVDRLRRHTVIGQVLYPMKGHNYDENDKFSISRDLEREVADSSSVEGCGEIHVSLSYNERIERLTIGIFEAKGLHVQNEHASPDFYTKICLVRHGEVVKTKKTSVMKRDVNPKFNESFVFKISADMLDSISFVVTVWQSLTGQKDKGVGRVVFGPYMFARGRELDHWNEMLANPTEQIVHWHPLV